MVPPLVGQQASRGVPSRNVAVYVQNHRYLNCLRSWHCALGCDWILDIDTQWFSASKGGMLKESRMGPGAGALSAFRGVSRRVASTEQDVAGAATVLNVRSWTTIFLDSFPAP